MTKRAAALVGLCVGALWLLHGVLAQELPFPSVGRTSLNIWLAVADPATVTMTALRAVALALAWYLVVIAGLQVVSTALGWRSKALDAITPALVKQAIGVSLTVGVTASTWIAPVLRTPASAESAESPPVTMVRLAEGSNDDFSPERGRHGAARPLPPSTPAEADDGMVMTRLGASETQNSTSTERTTWKVTQDEHFWQIATDVLEERMGRPATTSETDRYWRELVDRNRSRLVDPGNPDLLLPGQVIDLPPSS